MNANDQAGGVSSDSIFDHPLYEIVAGQIRRGVAEGVQKRIIKLWRDANANRLGEAYADGLRFMAKAAIYACIDEVPNADLIAAQEWGDNP